MSVQSARKAKQYLERLKKEFVDSHSIIRNVSRSERGAFDVHMYFHAVNHSREVAFHMAKVATTNSNGKVEFKGYVNYVLSADDKARFRVWEVDDHDLWLLMATDIQSGYKVSVTYNSQNDTFNATYTCNDNTSPNAGYCLSAFAKDWYMAVKSLVFKHNEVLGCVWPLDGKSLGNDWG